MNSTFMTKKSKPIPLRFYALGVAILWSLLIAISLVWNIKIEKSGTFEAALIEARTAFEKDVIYRRWNAMHGGVYAPVTEITQPNPYLNVPERDITTPSGKNLTKINPAYMTRQIHEMAMKTFGVKGHITSLNLLRPANAADPWETRALKAFETGAKEVSSVEEIEAVNYMRLMRPLLTEKGCLKCHAAQGYKLGDIRGGISVSVPMAPLLAIERSRILTFSAVLGLLWLTGLFGIGFGVERLSQQIQKRIGAEEALSESEKRLEKINECFLSFGTDSNENINRLTALCGELLGATCALYNRLDGDMLYSWGQWNTPVDYNPVDTPEGHICYDVIKNTGDEILVITNLSDTHYAQTDPNVIPYKLQTYVGRAVKLRDDYVGSLCAVYKDDIIPGESDKRALEIIASAIGVEEERKRAKGLLRDSEEKYRTVLEGNPDPVVVYDMQGRVGYFNPAFTNVFGWTLEERLSKKMDVFVPEEAWSETKMMIEKVLAGEMFSNIETRRQTKNGKIVPVSISGATYSGQDGNPLGSIINLRDISEQKKLEAQLQQAHKMESIGTLAGGIAHDFNNILSPIILHNELVLEDISKKDPLRFSLEEILRASLRAKDLVKQILTFGRQAEQERIPLIIYPVI